MWKLLERAGTQGIQLIVMVVLTRILLPEDFGLITIVVIFISIAALIIDSGFSEALIQKKNTSENDFSSVFYLNLVIACIVYSILFWVAPIIADFFNLTQLTYIIRILSCTLFFVAINSVQYAIIAKTMQFKKLFMSSLVGVVISGIIGLGLAFNNFGVWALIVQQLSSQFLVTIGLWFTVKWRPKLIFSVRSISQLYSYGWKLVTSTLIYNFYTQLQNILIAKMFSSTMLGFYNRGMHLPNVLVTNINGSIQSVLFPVLTKEQEDLAKIKILTQKSIVISSFLIFPMMVGLAVIAQPLVIILFTEKWLPTVPFLQIFCAYYALWTIDAANLHVIKALGRSDIFLKLEIIKFTIGLIILIWCAQFSIQAVAYGVLANRIITTIIDAYPNKYLIGYSFINQIKDVSPSIILSVIMGIVAYNINLFEFSVGLTIIVQIISGIILYVILAVLFKVECLSFLIKLMKEMIRNRKRSVMES